MLSIRPPRSHAEVRQVEALQRDIWQMDALDITPYNTLYAWQHSGGLLLCAFDDHTMVGFVAGFRGMLKGRALHWSHMAGVLPDYQGKGIGLQLKFAQRTAVLAQGLDYIAWTYDPLRVGNAWFNIVRLGGIVQRLYPEHYGPMTDQLNQGLLSDRFEVLWALRDVTVSTRAEGLPLPEAPQPQDFCLRCVEQQPQLTPCAPADWLGVEVPANLDELRMADPQLTHRWYYALRDAVIPLFAAGYVVRHVLRPNPQHFVYLLHNNA